MNEIEELLGSSMGIVIVFIILFITRELWTWFLKINKMVKQNDEIIRLLSEIANEPEPMTGAEKTGHVIGGLLNRKK